MPSLIANLNSEMLFCHEAFTIFPELFTDFERKFSVNTWEGANTRYIIMCRRQKNYTCMHIKNKHCLQRQFSHVSVCMSSFISVTIGAMAFKFGDSMS